jgi:hypothetical protein
MAVSRRLRFEILRRDNHACRYCGATAPEVKLTVDHVVPEALGGTDDPSNLVTACQSCNSGKTSIAPDSPLVDDVAADALRWARARERALATLTAERDALYDYVQGFFRYWEDASPQFAELPEDWDSSIVRFHDAGLPYDELIDATRRAFLAGHVPQRRRFVYMLGIGWNKVERIQAMTEEIVRSDDAGEGE